MKYTLPSHWEIIEDDSCFYDNRNHEKPMYSRKDNRAVIYHKKDHEYVIVTDRNDSESCETLKEAVQHADTLILMDFFNKNNPVSIKIARMIALLSRRDGEDVVGEFYKHGVFHDVGEGGNICLLAGRIETLAESE